ncbi:hypothetical protein BD289DRAFT_461677 [Coniella lustricola]|uniref:E3 ubiquitin-protein ligase listerin n=1 Tax=Coniella lustricola TaxID=2025994 RepID=A0A2T3A483_9PEZI|nr:hypothetical protein BD289DRAFT_461677 [Coniella lustricola]
MTSAMNSSTSSRGFGAPTQSAFGGFTASSGTSGSLSYLSDPPDLSSISDPNVIVSFKNLLKKDTTTKSKALADLIAYAQAHPHEQDGGVEDAVLDAWVLLYPRISIDNDRRVRELSHGLQFELLKSARKRMERNISKVAGAWLAGTFDRDKPVARAATEGLSTFLTTEDKILQFWKRCQSQVLQYATEAITETPDTLSDERSTKPEDAEAKYYRVIAAGFSLVLGLVQKLPDADLDRFDAEYEAFLSSGPGDLAWSFATADDSRVRKIVYQLLQLCLERRRSLVDGQIPRISKILTSDALKKSQLGSASDLVLLLAKLTQDDKEFWGTKKPPLSRLRSFVEKGSQGSPPSFWEGLNRLLAALPAEAIQKETALDFFKSFRTGLSRREEPRTNASYAWRCYLNAVSRLSNQADTESRCRIISEAVFPLTDHYLFASERQGEWLHGVDVSILAHAYKVAAMSSDAQVKEALSKEWTRLAEVFIARLSNSLPEVSKDFESSQKRIAEDARRWFSVTNAIHASLTASDNGNEDQSAATCPEAATWSVIRGAEDLLKRRNFKPFGAAALLLAALKQSPHLFTTANDGFWKSVVPINSDEELTRLLSSPSAPYIISCVETLGQIQNADYEAIWSAIVQALLNMRAGNAQVDPFIAKLMSTSAAKPLSRSNTDLQRHLEGNILACVKSVDGSWELFDATLVWDAISEARLTELASSIVELLASDNEPSIKATEVFLKRKPSIFAQNEALHLNLVTKLLSLTEINDPTISSKAAQLHALLEHVGDAQPSVLNIIQENLERPSQDSLSIETLVQQAATLLRTSQMRLEQILPNTTTWTEELSQFLQVDLNPALSLTSNVGDLYLLPPHAKEHASNESRRDSKDLSVPARMAMYTIALLDNGVELTTLPQHTQVDLLYLLHLVTALASDQMTLVDTIKLFGDLKTPGLLEEVEEFVVNAKTALRGILSPGQACTPGTGEGLLDQLIIKLIGRAQDLTPTGVYSARALCEILETSTDGIVNPKEVEEWITRLDIMKTSPTTVLPAAAVLTGYGEMLTSSKVVSTLLNRLISDVAGAKSQGEKTRLYMVLLNSCMSVFEVGQLPVANNRLVFAVKQITSWFEEGAGQLGAEMMTQSCRALQRLLPCIREVYGPYWEQTIEFCLSAWSSARKDHPERRLPYLHASIKLLSALRKFEEPNDDLQDALNAHADAIYGGLLDLLTLSGPGSQPQEIVDGLLCREAAKIPLEYLKDLSDLYSLVASESREVQTAGYEIIHRALPAAQEQISMDVLLEKKQAKLPDELTSLLLDAPTLEAFPEEVLVQFPTPIRSYLLSWKLVFDAFEGAAYKVRADYNEDLKTHGAVNPLFEFMFDVLGHSAANPINIDREGFTVDDIQTYDVKIGDSLPEEKNMHWLLIHLFYLALKFSPGLFKTWYLDCRSKQTRIAIEPWMTKYFSPILIQDAITEVQKWSESQDISDPDEKELTVKANFAQREVTAAYAIDDGGDEQAAAMLIRIKPNYPLDFVDVVGLNRVACSERTWQSWLRITQGIITISNGAIIDGLATFRRNVVGALKGHVECAICYSFIAVDRKMPDKKCATCKNLFHRDCLFKWFSSANQNTCPLCRTRMDLGDKKKVTKALRRPPVDGD